MVGNNVVFNLWFYVSHRIWHAYPRVYRMVHKHHHESFIVWPLSAFSNNYLESLWTAIGITIFPGVFMWYTGRPANAFAWFAHIFSIVLVSVFGHSRLPHTLEHAVHHLVLKKNFGFYSHWLGFPAYDIPSGTWTKASDVSSLVEKYYGSSTNTNTDINLKRNI
jgi:sterol desaturase/sphingolipid hydroxylase (fatty acid hydroxylase superfamily)